uniref:Putative response regulator receiver protein n=1 Tax=Magnetococcus massalia (strain MO-1) TaxID=451514 RepID=A0A1S7LGE8_MAGMO|nr:Putative response regulator receiver protein [Candidatus Magnetococcus massalia]
MADAARQSILVVDDTPFNIDVLKGLFATNYQVRAALSGADALKSVQNSPPDLILLDIMMPEMDGYAVCHALKERAETAAIPIIFITALEDDREEIKGLNLGAVDYIRKPFNPSVVVSRVETHLLLQDAQRRLERKNNKLIHERSLVEGIITRMRAADHIGGAGIRSLLTSVDKTNGDILLTSETEDGRQLIFLGDFTGHGLPAAVGSPLVSYIFNDQTQHNQNGRALLAEINSQLYAKLPPTIFLTASLVELSPDRRTAHIWNMAMPPAYVKRQGKIAHRLASCTVPLGINDELHPNNVGVSLELEAGDRLYLFSDGALEPTRKDDEMFGEKRLVQWLEQELTPTTPLEELLDQLQRFLEGGALQDDVSIVEITPAIAADGL